MDIKLNYMEKGTGFPLILLHGNGEDMTYFEHQIEYFSALFRVIAIDTRGHGGSPRGDGEFTIRRFADDLHDFMCDHCIDKADILGFSDGGNIALCFALKYPEMVDRLILNGANLNARGVKLSVQLPIEIGYRLASLFAKKSAEAKHNAELLGLMVNDPNIDPSELEKIACPTLVIAGNKDMIKKKHTSLIAEKIPNARMSIIDGDHFVANRNPDVFNRVVGDFLGV